jgi:hypothetical protein
MAQWMVTERMTRVQAAQRMMGRQMMRGRRRRGLLGVGITSEAYGKRSRDEEDFNHRARFRPISRVVKRSAPQAVTAGPSRQTGK